MSIFFSRKTISLIILCHTSKDEDMPCPPHSTLIEKNRNTFLITKKVKFVGNFINILIIDQKLIFNCVSKIRYYFIK